MFYANHYKELLELREAQSSCRFHQTLSIEGYITNISSDSHVLFKVSKTQIPPLKGRYLTLLIEQEALLPLVVGMPLSLKGELQQLPEQRTPYTFSIKDFSHRSHRVGSLRVSSATRLPWKLPHYLSFYTWKARNSFQKKISASLPQGSDVQTIILAATLGEKPPFESSLSSIFLESGTFHVFAVSGLHVGIITCLAWWISGILSIHLTLRILLVWLCMASYVWITGCHPPAIRAGILISLFLLSLLVKRPFSPVNALFASGLLTLFGDSQLLFTASFQLSYGVFASILLMSSFFKKRLHWIAQKNPLLPNILMTYWQKKRFKFRCGLRDAYAVSIAAWIGSTPLTWLWFGIITPISLLISPLLILLVTLLLSLSISSFFLSFLHPLPSYWINQCNAQVAKTCLFVASTAQKTPYSSFTKSSPHLPHGRIMLCDIPHGGGASLLDMGGGVLIDTGHTQTSSKILPILKAWKLSCDSVIFTHWDAWHVMGLEQLAPNCAIKQIIAPYPNIWTPTVKYISTLAKALRAHLLFLRERKFFYLEKGCFLEVLRPYLSTHSPFSDDAGIAILLHWHHWKILWMGDAGWAFEEALVSAYPHLQADCVIMGSALHDFSGNPAFFQKINARLVWRTHSSYPSQQHCPEDWIQALNKQGIMALSQEKTGALLLELRGKQLHICPTLKTIAPIILYPR